jgi:hypothetical protein
VWGQGDPLCRVVCGNPFTAVCKSKDTRQITCILTRSLKLESHCSCFPRSDNPLFMIFSPKHVPLPRLCLFGHSHATSKMTDTHLSLWDYFKLVSLSFGHTYTHTHMLRSYKSILETMFPLCLETCLLTPCSSISHWDMKPLPTTFTRPCTRGCNSSGSWKRADIAVWFVCWLFLTVSGLFLH